MICIVKILIKSLDIFSTTESLSSDILIHFCMKCSFECQQSFFYCCGDIKKILQVSFDSVYFLE